jgi:hypothetical protein
MLTKRAPDLDGVLNTYRKIRIGKQPVLDEEQSLIKNHLKLSGVICREKLQDRPGEPQKISDHHVLRLRNPIYSEVFDGAWIKEHMPVNWFAKARQSGVLIVAVLLAVSVVGLVVSNRWAAKERALAQEEARKANIQLAAAEEKAQLAQDNLVSILQGDAKSREYLEYQKNADGQLTEDYRAYQKNSAQDPSRTPALKTPERIETIYDTPERGALKVALFAGNAVRVTRTGPAPNRIEVSTWVPAPPNRVESAPGPLDGARSSLSEDRMPTRERVNAEFRHASLTAPAPLSSAPVGNCLNPHPGAFRSWYGEKNGCWVAVYRQWPDGCTHYQWYNACTGAWDIYPNGAPKVYWTVCVH